MADLTDRQREIVEFVRGETVRAGVPPSVREIARRMRIRSTRTVFDHLKALERKGVLRRRPGHRGLVLAGRPVVEAPAGREGTDRPPAARPRGIPLVGRVAAGGPTLAAEEIEGYMEFDTFFGPSDDLFLLRVVGDSMIDAGIWDGDFVVVRRAPKVPEGAVGVVLLDEEEATVKRVFMDAEGLRLEPANERYRPIRVGRSDGRNVRILGEVVGVVRRA
ncbi:MAG: transcriptional repressor LexA [Planctomycetes bacterium]|nr:transcriptional repressor LexA [Planctomycetota bacterium]